MSKKKRGRPFINPDEPLDQQLTFRLSQREAELLDLYCWRHDISEGSAIRFALDVLGIT